MLRGARLYLVGFLLLIAMPVSCMKYIGSPEYYLYILAGQRALRSEQPAEEEQLVEPSQSAEDQSEHAEPCRSISKRPFCPPFSPRSSLLHTTIPDQHEAASTQADSSQQEYVPYDPYKPIARSAYFKHFKSPGRSREIIAFYTKHGDFLDTFEVTGYIDYQALYAFYRLKLVNDLSPIISYKRRALGCLIGYTRLHGIISSERRAKNDKKWRRKNNYPFLEMGDQERLIRHITDVAYCSAYDEQTNRVIEMLRERINKNQISHCPVTSK